MKKAHLWWWLASLLLALGLVAQYVIYRAEPSSGLGHAAWSFQPTSFREVVNQAQTIVQAEVVGIEKGPDIIVAAKGEPSGQDVIPTQRIRMKVLSTEKGGTKAGDEIVVFRTGGETALPNAPTGSSDPKRDAANVERIPAPASGKPADANSKAPDRPAVKPDPQTPAEASNVRYLMLEDDPPYRQGEQYYMLLEPGPNNTNRPVSPEGRYRITAGRAAAVTDSDVGTGVNGQTLETLKDAARGTRNIETGRGGGGLSKRVETDSPVPGMPTTGLPDQFWLVVLATGALALLGGMAMRRRRAS